MENNFNCKQLFHEEVMQGVYLISDADQEPTELGQLLAPGKATGNSYLILGEQRAVLIDLAVNSTELQEYAKQLAGKRELRLVLTHGHYDHAYHAEMFSELWMHPADEYMLRNGMIGLPPVDPCPKINPILDGDIIDLGGRQLKALNIPGHTDGSILLLDEANGVMFSGDTCARRLLYGVWSNVPPTEFCACLRRLYDEERFDVFYSAHDRCALPKAYILHMIDMIENQLPKTEKTWVHPAVGEMACLTYGDECTLDYFDMVAPRKYL